MKSAFVQEITLDDQYYIQSNMRINEDYAQYFDNRGLLDHSIERCDRSSSSRALCSVSR